MNPNQSTVFWQLLWGGGVLLIWIWKDFLLYRIFWSLSVLCCLRIDQKVQIFYRKRFQNSKYAPSLVHWIHKERTPASTGFLICLWKQKQFLKNRSSKCFASTSSHLGCKKVWKEGFSGIAIYTFFLKLFLFFFPTEITTVFKYGVYFWGAGNNCVVSQYFLLGCFPWKVLTQISLQTSLWYCQAFPQIWKKMG